MFIEPTITWVPSGFSGYIWLDTKIVLKKHWLCSSLAVIPGFHIRVKCDLVSNIPSPILRT